VEASSYRSLTPVARGLLAHLLNRRFVDASQGRSQPWMQLFKKGKHSDEHFDFHFDLGESHIIKISAVPSPTLTIDGGVSSVFKLFRKGQ